MELEERRGGGVTKPFGGRPWTAEEEDILRARFVAEGAKAMAVALGRTVNSVNHRTQRLGLYTHRRWSARDDKRLAMLWGDFDVAKVAAELGRTEATTVWRSQLLGLSLGVQQGMEGLSAAAARVGYSVSSLRMILRWTGVQVRNSIARTHNGPRRNCMVDPDSVDEAVAEWLKTETLHAGANRHGVSAAILGRWLATSGLKVPAKPKGKRHWRIPSDVIDAAVAKGQTVIPLRAAAQRLGIHPGTLSHRAVRAGIPRPPGKLWLVDIRAVEALAS